MKEREFYQRRGEERQTADLKKERKRRPWKRGADGPATDSFRAREREYVRLHFSHPPTSETL